MFAAPRPALAVKSLHRFTGFMILPPLDRCVGIVLLTAPSLRSDRPPTFDNLSKALRGEAQMRRYGRNASLACFYRGRIRLLGFYLCLFVVADTVGLIGCPRSKK
jgi:hypothetical protein